MTEKPGGFDQSKFNDLAVLLLSRYAVYDIITFKDGKNFLFGIESV